MRRAAAVAALLAVLAGCAPESGTVYSRSTVFINKQPKTKICVQHGAEKGCDVLDFGAHKRCTEGASWPSCKDGGR